MISRVLRPAAGLGLGALSALAEAPLLLFSVVFRRSTMDVRLARFEHRRVGRYFGDAGEFDPDRREQRRYLLARVPVGLLGGILLVLLAFGVLVVLALLYSWIFQRPLALVDSPDAPISGTVIALNAVPGLVLLYLNLAGLYGVSRWELALARRLLGPDRERQLALRVAALHESRAEVVAAVDEERRRIERDLHDGVQQRLVALGLLLGRARRSPQRAAELLAQAHAESGRALDELREVAWRVYPAVLDDDGLSAALELLAERCPLPVRLRTELVAEPPAAVRTVAYFVACEALTNATKHSKASTVDIEVSGVDGRLTVVVADDGRGGAEAAGGGLSGLARRVAAADGCFEVHSPAGGPTLIRAELPCG